VRARPLQGLDDLAAAQILEDGVVVLAPEAPGRGLVAGSSVRTVLELAGVTDVTAKLMSRSKNKINNARVAMEALKKLL